MNLELNHGNYLLDFYGELLTLRQKEVLSLYFNYDYSMQEIAERLAISKSAVADIMHRALEQLETYEEKLKLIANHKSRVKIYAKLAELNDRRIDEYLKALQDIE